MKTQRQRVIYDYLTPCACFGDVGCDHGVFTYEMLTSKKAQTAVYSDISAACLQKARVLTAPYAARATGVVCDGITEAHAPCDQVLIAGMGGMEIVKILQNAPTLPTRLVLQPMKDAESVRKAVVALGYAVEKDTLFTAEGKYYYIVTANKGQTLPPYSEREYRYGRDNLRDLQADFLHLLQVRREELTLAAARAKESALLAAELAEIEEILQNGTH
ncbi:MAG: tRNA (adenine(22)-N(1))-methyltransferase TrmK [Clostridia bacterium]|nr:tRNA (adenine(22)-N(1))-methyltransferase TrmK [Clostridia bacterium]